MIIFNACFYFIISLCTGDSKNLYIPKYRLPYRSATENPNFKIYVFPIITYNRLYIGRPYLCLFLKGYFSG